MVHCHIWSFVSYERPVLDDKAKLKNMHVQQAALFYDRGLEMVKKQCPVWSQVCTNSPLSTRPTAKPILVKTKTKDFMKTADFHIEIASFHFKTEDHLQGIVTPMFCRIGIFAIFRKLSNKN